MGKLDFINIVLRIALAVPIIWFLIFQHKNKHLNGKFYLIRKFTTSVATAFLLFVGSFIFSRLVAICGVDVLNSRWVQVVLAVSHIFSIGLLVDAAKALKAIRNQEQKRYDECHE